VLFIITLKVKWLLYGFFILVAIIYIYRSEELKKKYDVYPTLLNPLMNFLFPDIRNTRKIAKYYNTDPESQYIRKLRDDNIGAENSGRDFYTVPQFDPVGFRKFYTDEFINRKSSLVTYQRII
jgi:hypothetical protein